MATGLRDEIKTMRGRRQEAGGAQRSPLIDGSLSLALPPFRGQTGRGGWNWEDSEREEGGEKGQAALGLHRCTNSGNCLSSKRRSFSSQGSNWTCQTVHLHGNDYFYFVARLSQRPRICTKEQQLSSHTGQGRGCSVHAWTLPNEVTDSASNQYGWLFYSCF